MSVLVLHHTHFCNNLSTSSTATSDASYHIHSTEVHKEFDLFDSVTTDNTKVLSPKCHMIHFLVGFFPPQNITTIRKN